MSLIKKIYSQLRERQTEMQKHEERMNDWVANMSDAEFAAYRENDPHYLGPHIVDVSHMKYTAPVNTQEEIDAQLAMFKRLEKELATFGVTVEIKCYRDFEQATYKLSELQKAELE